MKKLLCVGLSLLLVLSLFAGCEQKPETPTGTTVNKPANPVLRCSTTTSVNDSKLMAMLEPLFEAETGYDLQITSNGTGAAIKLGETGDADVILVHAKASEEEFIANGFGIKRIPFMFNFFVIVGPKDDPAGIKGSASAADALKKISEKGSKLVSRGDDSGTHKKELALWKAAGIEPKAETDKWYISAGKGMGDCLTMANESGAYVLTDKGTYLSMKANLENLEIVLNESDDMKNTYSLIACNPEKNAGLNTEGANAFIEWMTKKETLDKIAEFGISQYGEALFFVE